MSTAAPAPIQPTTIESGTVYTVTWADGASAETVRAFTPKRARREDGSVTNESASWLMIGVSLERLRKSLKHQPSVGSSMLEFSPWRLAMMLVCTDQESRTLRSGSPSMDASAPKPMDPERLDDIREGVEWRRERPMPMDDDRDGIIAALLADRDYHEQRAEPAERERDELLRGLANVGNEMDGMEAEFDAMGTAGRVTRAAASLMVTAVRLHPKIETGITCCVEVDGRKMDVIAQWVDAPVVTNWVSMAADMLRGRAEAEQERNDAMAEMTDHRAKTAARIERLTDEWRTESARLRAEVARAMRRGITLEKAIAWARANGVPDAFLDGVLSDGRHDEAACIGGIALGAARMYVDKCGLDILDEMAAMPLEPEPRKCTNCDATLKAGEQGECSVCEARRSTRTR
jgi:hypothetical protein